MSPRSFIGISVLVLGLFMAAAYGASRLSGPSLLVLSEPAEAAAALEVNLEGASNRGLWRALSRRFFSEESCLGRLAGRLSAIRLVVLSHQANLDSFAMTLDGPVSVRDVARCARRPGVTSTSFSRDGLEGIQIESTLLVATEYGLMIGDEATIRSWLSAGLRPRNQTFAEGVAQIPNDWMVRSFYGLLGLTVSATDRGLLTIRATFDTAEHALAAEQNLPLLLGAEPTIGVALDSIGGHVRNVRRRIEANVLIFSGQLH